MQDLLSTKVNSPSIFKRKILLIGSCINQDHPQIIKKVRKERVILSTCLEKDHMNVVESKLVTIIRVSKINDLCVLTVDGSPHCWQLHMISESLKYLFGDSLKVTNYVVEKGELIKISHKVIKTARHLSAVKKLVESCN